LKKRGGRPERWFLPGQKRETSLKRQQTLKRGLKRNEKKTDIDSFLTGGKGVGGKGLQVEKQKRVFMARPSLKAAGKKRGMLSREKV